MPKLHIVYRGTGREQLELALKTIAPTDNVAALLAQHDNGEFHMLAEPIGDLSVGRDLNERTWTMMTHSSYRPEQLAEQQELLRRGAPGVDVAFADDILGRS